MNDKYGSQFRRFFEDVKPENHFDLMTKALQCTCDVAIILHLYVGKTKEDKSNLLMNYKKEFIKKSLKINLPLASLTTF